MLSSVISRSILRQYAASSSRLAPRSAAGPLRWLNTSSPRCDTNVMAELEKQLHPREIVERKKREFEEKYGDKLKKRAEAEGVQDIEALKEKVMAPSVKAALKARSRAKEYKAAKQVVEEQGRAQDPFARAGTAAQAAPAQKAKRAEPSQAEGDRSGIKPLSSIINLPLLHLTPHDAEAISQIWTSYHTTHKTLSNSFLSASLPASTYKSMLELARQNPFFVLPLPRLAAEGEGQDANANAQVRTDEYEMFYLQWLFHPTPSSGPPSPEESPEQLPLTTSIIFTPLEEFKKSGEWAQPYLVLTHYPDLTQTHSLVLMRGEISPASASGPNTEGSLINPGFLLSQQQGQLLALALQRFYCANIEPMGENAKRREERLKRADALRGFRERPGEWDWNGLVHMAYGGIV